MTTVLILAAGEQARWEKAYGIKQFRPIEKEPLIIRTQRQVKDRGQMAFVITHNPEIARASKRILAPRARRWIAETLKSTAHIWTERVIVLLGDVVYSKACMDAIVVYDGPIRFWGNLYEIFALSFDDRVMTEMFTAIDKAIYHAEYDGGPGKLRKVYQAFVGLDFEDNEIHRDEFEEVLAPDYTRDFDSIKDWKNFVKEVLNPRRLDDLPGGVR